MFTVVFDANVLYPSTVRDLLVRLARARLFHGRWTDCILDEAFEAIMESRPDLLPERLLRTRTLLCDAVPDCLVEGWESLVDGLSLPDPDDRHVLAAAIRSGAQVIVTHNIKDFPATSLDPFNIEAQHPDLFIMNLVDLSPGVVTTVLHQLHKDLKNPPTTIPALLDRMDRSREPPPPGCTRRADPR